MYTNRADFVFTVSRDFVRSVQTPLLIAPNDVTAHPYAVAMEVAGLAPNAEVTIYPWKDSQEHVDKVVEHARRFLKAHAPAGRRRDGAESVRGDPLTGSGRTVKIGVIVSSRGGSSATSTLPSLVRLNKNLGCRERLH